MCVFYGANFGTSFGFDFRVSADTAILDGFLVLLSARPIPWFLAFTRSGVWWACISI